MRRPAINNKLRRSSPPKPSWDGDSGAEISARFWQSRLHICAAPRSPSGNFPPARLTYSLICPCNGGRSVRVLFFAGPVLTWLRRRVKFDLILDGDSLTSPQIKPYARYRSGSLTPPIDGVTIDDGTSITSSGWRFRLPGLSPRG